MVRALPHVLRSLPTGLAVALLGAASAQWSTDPAQNTAVVVKGAEQWVPKVAASPDGATWVSWFDGSAGVYQVYAQRLDAAGNKTFPDAGLLISDHPQSSSLVDWALIADTAGAAVIVFTDTRDGADRDVFAYRIAPDGTFLWGPDGVQLSANDDFEPAPRVAQTTDGSYAVIWARLPSTGDGGVMLQRLLPNGAKQFANPLTIVTQANEDPAFCDLVAGWDGSIIVSWVRDISTFASPRHVRVRKFNADGAPGWPSFQSVYDEGSGVPIAHWPGIATDGNGGALLWWHRADGGSMYNAFVQHVDAFGFQLWPHNGVAVSTVTTQHHIDPTLSYDPASSNTYVFWNERNAVQSQWGIYGQRFDAIGNRNWGNQGLAFVPLSTVFKDAPRSVPIGNGAMVFVRDEPTGQFGKDRVLGLRVDAAGTKLWGSNPVVVSSVLSSKSRLPVAIGCEGAARMVWEDDRNGTIDVYGQCVLPAGTLGAPPSAWTDLGFALAGTHGAPTLVGSGPPCSGGLITLSLGNALENTVTFLVVGFSAITVPFKGGTLVPNPDFLLLLPTGPAGAVPFGVTLPPGVPAGVSLWFQHWVIDAAGPAGYAASGAVKTTTL
jgi:hypothetical protein